jgi:DNA-binding MarR family transcriptional regulator
MPRTQTPPAAGKGSKGFELWRAAMRWQRAVDRALAPLDLTHTQFLLLTTADSCVSENGDAVAQRTVATAAGLDEATTSRVMRTLSDRGLVDRGPTFGDQRQFRLLVTSEGRQLLKIARPEVQAVERQMFGQRKGKG